MADPQPWSTFTCHAVFQMPWFAKRIVARKKRVARRKRVAWRKRVARRKRTARAS